MGGTGMNSGKLTQRMSKLTKNMIVYSLNYNILICRNVKNEEEIVTVDVYEIQTRDQYTPWPLSESSVWADTVSLLIILHTLHTMYNFIIILPNLTNTIAIFITVTTMYFYNIYFHSQNIFLTSNVLLTCVMTDKAISLATHITSANI